MGNDDLDWLDGDRKVGGVLLLHFFGGLFWTVFQRARSFLVTAIYLDP